MIMEAVFGGSSPSDHHHHHQHQYSSISTYTKKMKKYPTNKNSTWSFISRSNSIGTNYMTTPMNYNNNIHGGAGLLMVTTQNYPPNSYSYNNYNSVSSVPNPILLPNQKTQQQNQPPLLPLPISNFKPHRSFSHDLNRTKPNRNRDQSVTPRKAKQATKRELGSKQEIMKKLLAKADDQSNLNNIDVNKSNYNLPRIGPDPNYLPKDVCKMLLLSSSSKDNLDEVFGSSPPPSSLPLPKFFMRPKLVCNAEAAATDGLRLQ